MQTQEIRLIPVGLDQFRTRHPGQVCLGYG